MSEPPIKKRWYVEYALLRAIAFLARIVPYRISLFGAWLLAILMYPVMRSRVREAKRRIRIVLGDSITKQRVNRIAWISFRNTIFSAVEMLRFPITTGKWVKNIFDCRETMEALLMHAEKSGTGAIIAVPHTGSWDLACVVSHAWGIPIFNFTGEQRNPFINDYMNYLRASPGIEFIARGSSAYRQAIRLLKAGKFCAILPDVRMRSGGIEVEFLGATANIGTGAAFFASMANVPVFPCIVSRSGWTGHKIIIHPPITPDKSLDKAEDLGRITRQLLVIMEKFITDNPEQWFWYNKRWILDPVEK